MFRSLIVSAAVLAAVATAARAADPAPAADVRCLAVASFLAGNADPKVQNAGVLAALYYLGKLDGREPGMDLEARLKEVAMQLSPKDIQSEAVRCGAELGARGKTMNEIGLRLQALGAGKAP
jgi:hypothetical protein